MKLFNILFCLLVGILFTSCDENPIIKSENGTELRVTIVDGCEYIYYSGGDKGYMAHKGNCKNPIHEHNK